jgi:hypothetical protein
MGTFQVEIMGNLVKIVGIMRKKVMGRPASYLPILFPYLL